MLEIKKATLRDWSKIQLIAHKTWWQSYGEMLPKEQVEYMLDLIYSESALSEQMTIKKHEFILVFEDEIPLGFASYQIDYHSLSTLMIHKIYLLPQTQGKGIGTKLIDHIAAIAIRNNNNKLQLKVYHENEKAIGFYLKYGFVNIGTETKDIGKGYVILDNIMTKNLAH